MNWTRHFVLASLWLASVTSPLDADAVYYVGMTQYLEIWSIGTESFWDHGAPISTGVPGFTITVDPLFMDPTLQVVETNETSGAGEYDAYANTPHGVSGNPFDIVVGDSVRTRASVDGSVRNTTTGDSFAKSFASLETTIFLVNTSDVEVFVDVLWDTTEAIYESGSGPEGQADAYHSVDPGLSDGGATPIAYGVAPGTTREVVSQVSAWGSAFAPQAVPEPASMAIWGTLGVFACAVRAACWLQTHRQIQA